MADLETRAMQLGDIYKELSAPFPEKAIQRASKSDTRKGYDTTGIGYQFIVNRFNEVLGIDNWWFDYDAVDINTGAFANGKPFKELAVAVTIYIRVRDEEIVTRRCVGGHISSTYADALKGAITNAFKKTAALFGVGKQAYEGTLDDDISYESEIATSNTKETTVAKVEKGEQKTEQKQEVALLTYEVLLNKISTASNVFELNNRCKKYVKSYEACTQPQRDSIVKERDRRKLYLETGGLGSYEDFVIVEKREAK